MRKILPVILVAMTLASAGRAAGQEGAFVLDQGYFAEGIRPFGMGGAFTAVSDDENAIMYNPAGLAWAKGGFTLHAGIAADLDDVKDLSVDTIVEEDGSIETNGTLLGALAFKGHNFALAAFNDIDLNERFFLSPADPTTARRVEEVRGMVLPAVACSFRPVSTLPLAVGASAKGAILIRDVKIYDTPFSSGSAGEETQISKSSVDGFGISGNVGALMRFSILSVGASVQDVVAPDVEVTTTTDYLAGSMEGTSQEDKFDVQVNPRLRVGAAVHIPNVPVVSAFIGNILFASDIDWYKNDGRADDPSDNRKFTTFHVGTELEFLRIGWLAQGTLRAGLAFTSVKDADGDKIRLTPETMSSPLQEISHWSLSAGLGARIVMVDANIGLRVIYPDLEDGSFPGGVESLVQDDRTVTQALIAAGVNF
jgi:hypothetical protein